MEKPFENPTKEITFWENFGRGHGEGTFYQMGDNIVRTYILNEMERLGVKSLLDNGCGSGPIYELIRDKKLDIQHTGADYSGSFIEYDKKVFPETRWEHVDARNMSIFKDGEFDAVLFLHAIDSVKEWEKALSEAARVAKKYVFIVLWRPFQTNGTHNIHTDENWADTHLVEFDRQGLELEFSKNRLSIYNSHMMYNKKQYNWIYVLEKHE